MIPVSDPNIFPRVFFFVSVTCNDIVLSVRSTVMIKLLTISYDQNMTTETTRTKKSFCFFAAVAAHVAVDHDDDDGDDHKVVIHTCCLIMMTIVSVKSQMEQQLKTNKHNLQNQQPQKKKLHDKQMDCNEKKTNKQHLQHNGPQALVLQSTTINIGVHKEICNYCVKLQISITCPTIEAFINQA